MKCAAEGEYNAEVQVDSKGYMNAGLVYKCKEKLEILHFIEIKCNETKEVIYTCSYTSGHLITTSIILKV